MKGSLIHSDGTRTFAVVFDNDDEFVSGLREFARKNDLDASSFTAIGAFSSVVLEFFDRVTMKYNEIPVNEQAEVLSLIGNIALDDGEPKVHAHVVVGMADATARGGHVKEARVWPTLEVIVQEAPVYLKRKTDLETGLPLLDLPPEARA